MLFPTLEFGIFFTIVFFSSWALRHHTTGRKILLTTSSFIFYSWWDWRYAFLLLGCCLTAYFFAGIIHKKKNPIIRKRFLYFSLCLLLGALVVFKYLGFLSLSANRLAGILGLNLDMPLVQVLLPVGISFFTFQAMSYLIDVYRGSIPASRSLLDVTMYISFFPQLVAGPIIRANVMLPQIEAKPNPSEIQSSRAFLLIMAGLVKKVILASYLATELVDPAFGNPAAFSGFQLLLAAYGYAIQIYCDFSAYSDIAIGVALLLGYRFPDNFRWPYRASSLTDFWRRWHISLSTWLRDYLFLPIAYVILRKSSGKKYLGMKSESFSYITAMMITMLLGGLWHGAKWTFIIWGGIHGFGLAAEKGLSRKFGKWWKKGLTAEILSIIVVFNFVCLAWIFFRSPSIDSATYYLGIMFSSFAGPVLVSPFIIFLLIIGIVSQFIPQVTRTAVRNQFALFPALLQGLILGGLLLMISAFSPQGVAPFIYFRF